MMTCWKSFLNSQYCFSLFVADSDCYSGIIVCCAGTTSYRWSNFILQGRNLLIGYVNGIIIYSIVVTVVSIAQRFCYVFSYITCACNDNSSSNNNNKLYCLFEQDCFSYYGNGMFCGNTQVMVSVDRVHASLFQLSCQQLQRIIC